MRRRGTDCHRSTAIGRTPTNIYVAGPRRCSSAGAAGGQGTRGGFALQHPPGPTSPSTRRRRAALRGYRCRSASRRPRCMLLCLSDLDAERSRRWGSRKGAVMRRRDKRRRRKKGSAGNTTALGTRTPAEGQGRDSRDPHRHTESRRSGLGGQPSSPRTRTEPASREPVGDNGDRVVARSAGPEQALRWSPSSETSGCGRRMASRSIRSADCIRIRRGPRRRGR